MKIFLALAVSTALLGCERNPLNWQQIDAEIRNKFSDVEHIDINQFVDATENKDAVLIIDVRAPEEYAVSHIPGALNITDPSKIADLAKASDKDVIVYCSVGYRSAIVAQEILDSSDIEVANFQGSIFAWANAGMALENKSGTTKDVHPYDNHWGQLLEENVPKSFGTTN